MITGSGEVVGRGDVGQCVQYCTYKMSKSRDLMYSMDTVVNVLNTGNLLRQYIPGAVITFKKW